MDDMLRKLIALSDDDLPEQLRQALAARGEDQVDELLELLYDERFRSTRLHYHIIEILGKTGDKRVVCHLIPFLTDEDEGDCDRYAFESLLLLGPLSVDELLEVFWDDPDAYAFLLAEIARDHPDPRVNLAIRGLISADPVMGAECAEVLNDASMVPSLVKAARDWGAHHAFTSVFKHFGVTPLHARTAVKSTG